MDMNLSFPAQKKSFKEKNEAWRKACIDAAESYSLWRNEGLRKSYYNKRINYNLYSDILDQNDVERTCNPLGILGLTAPAKMQNYPICNPKIDVLIGESIKRRFEWKVKVTNDEAISEKEEEMKEMFTQLMTSHIQEEKDEKKMQEELANFQKFANYEYQDLRERTATHILKYLYHQQRMDHKFATGFKDALLGAEEIYQWDIVAGEPVFTKLNTMQVHTVRGGDSHLIEDSDIIMISGYMSPGKIIDTYHEYLQPHDISRIESGMDDGPINGLGIHIGRKPELAIKVDESIDLAILKGDMAYGYGMDTEGNLRVTRTYWKSLRKMFKVKSYDEQGDMFYHLEDENYKIDKDKGEEKTEIWITEWWEGHKIGGGFGDNNDEKAIYVKMQPRPVQFRSMENPSKCHPGIIGTIYCTNDNQGVSLMDRMKPYQYLYNILAYNTELAISKNYGKIMRLDLASIPENWQIDQWMSFAQGMNIAVVDSFKEGNKGQATGKLSGAMNVQSPVIDMEMGNTIQLYMNMMTFIKQQMGEIAGVSEQRQGQIENREAVGNVERSMIQSSAITEYWFMEHEYVKLRCLEVGLETAKYAWKGKSKKLQYITDDSSQMILNIDGEQFNECEYGLQITTQASTQELINAMKSLAQAGLQNGMITYSQLLDIYSTDSISSIRRKIEKSENDKYQRDQKANEDKKQMQEQQLIAQGKEADKQRDFTREQWDREDANVEKTLENKLEVERLRQENEQSSSFKKEDDTSNDISTLESLRLQADKIHKDYMLKLASHNETVRSNKVGESQKDEEIKIKKKVANKPATGKK